jgi:chemotaxis protein methyltransferase CheR
VFCRNVIIYFPDDEITALLGRIAAGLEPGGLLFLGYSESLSWLQSPFERIRLGDTFVYRVVAAGNGAPARPARSARPGADRRPSSARRPLPPKTGAPSATPSAGPATAPDPGRAEPFLTEGQEAFAAGDAGRAVAAFRKAAYLRPGDASIALHLAFAFDAFGDTDSALRWFRLAHEAIATSGSGPLLEGWSPEELTRLLERKLAIQGSDE